MRMECDAGRHIIRNTERCKLPAGQPIDLACTLRHLDDERPRLDDPCCIGVDHDIGVGRTPVQRKTRALFADITNAEARTRRKRDGAPIRESEHLVGDALRKDADHSPSACDPPWHCAQGCLEGTGKKARSQSNGRAYHGCTWRRLGGSRIGCAPQKAFGALLDIERGKRGIGCTHPARPEASHGHVLTSDMYAWAISGDRGARPSRARGTRT